MEWCVGGDERLVVMEGEKNCLRGGWWMLSANVNFFACTAEMHWMGLSVPFYISRDGDLSIFI